MHTSILSALCSLLLTSAAFSHVTYPIVDTAQNRTYGERSEINYPKPGDQFYGQDAQYVGAQPAYKVNGDGTVSDNVTGLMWTQDPGKKMTFNEAVKGASKCKVAGHADWRLPTIKELYSLIQLNGTDPDPMSRDASNLKPFINDSVFKFTYGKEEDGERIIDSQFATSTKYVSTTMRGADTMFGVNFADGRIKGYGTTDPRGRREKTFYVLYVRNNPDYGKNKFQDNGDGTITDLATSLTWMQADSATGMDWPTALEYAEGLKFAGHSDWRLPNAKELQSIIDYSRSPDTTDSAAIDPIFEATVIQNEGGKKDFAHYWTSSTHVGVRSSDTAVYFAFGRSLGWMSDRRSNSGGKTLMDVHGAGSQRSDPKVGDASRFPEGRGPQGDVIRIENMVRCVRGGHVENEAAQPNIVFILIDDMHWNGTSVQIDPELPNSKSGIYHTPELEKLAAAGMRFTNAYAPGPMCTPSRAAILAGKTPAEIQMTTPGGGRSQDYQKLIGAEHIREFPTEITTLAESLKAAGYKTAHLGKWHLGRESPTLHGFDLHDGATANEVPNSSAENPKDIFGITERAIAFMEQQTASNTPFYLQLSHYAVHSPTETRASSKALFADAPSTQRLDGPAIAGMTYDVDASIGLLREQIEALGIANHTYLVVMSDNGGMGSGPRPSPDDVISGGKGSLQEGGIRVPFFAVGPGIEPDSISRESITGCDLFPTFCHWSGTTIPQNLEGINLASLLAGQQRELPRRALLFHYPHYGQGPKQKPQSALILGDYKLLYDWESQSAQLFNLSQDLLESTDLSKELPEGTAKLTSQLFERLNAADAQLPSANPDYDPAAKAPTGPRSSKRK